MGQKIIRTDILDAKIFSMGGVASDNLGEGPNIEFYDNQTGNGSLVQLNGDSGLDLYNGVEFQYTKTASINKDGDITAKSFIGNGSQLTGITESQVSGLTTDLNNKQDLLVSGTSIKTINGNSLLGSGDITIIAGESTPITGTVAIAMGNEESSKIITINDSTITLASLKEYAFINIETSETSLDDFTLNGLSFGIENIVDNVSFDIRANATNNASGDYTIKYIITI